MSSFSYPCHFPVGMPILDLTNSDTTIADLDLAAARRYAEREQSSIVSRLWVNWDDEYVGSMWPIGMPLEDAMHFYWNSVAVQFAGISGDFYNNDGELVFLTYGSSTVEPLHNFVNVFTNNSCPDDGYNAKNNGDEYYALKTSAPLIVANESRCMSYQPWNGFVSYYNYDSCFPVGNDIFFNLRGFVAGLGFLNNTFNGGDGTRESLRQKYPALIKIDNLYYPAISVSFTFEGDAFDNNAEQNIYGIFDAATYQVLYRGEETAICFDEFPSFSFTSHLEQYAEGPFDLQLIGFPSGNTYNIPLYNIYGCSGDKDGSCLGRPFTCGSRPINVELGLLELIPKT